MVTKQAMIDAPAAAEPAATTTVDLFIIIQVGFTRLILTSSCDRWRLELACRRLDRSHNTRVVAVSERTVSVNTRAAEQHITRDTTERDMKPQLRCRDTLCPRNVLLS